MTQLSYALSDSFKNLIRNFSTNLSYGISYFIYLFFINIFLKGIVSISNIIHFEQEQASNVANFTQVDTSTSLILLLLILKYAGIIGLTFLIAFACSHFFLSVKKESMIRKKELAIQRFLGATALYSAGEFFLEQTYNLFVAFILSSSILLFFYSELVSKLPTSIIQHLYIPASIIKLVDLPIFIGIILLLIGSFSNIVRTINQLL